MKQILKKARTKMRNAIGETKRGVRWIDPEELTESEQAAMYRDFFNENQKRLKKQNEKVKAWRKKNRVKCLAYCKQYHLDNKTRRSEYNKKLQKMKKNGE